MKFKNKLLLFMISLILFMYISPNYKYTITTYNKVYGSRIMDTDYYDYSELKALNLDYSYSTLLINEDTEFKIIDSRTTGRVTLSNSETLGKDLPSIVLKDGEEVVLLITNCAVNKSGEKLDVVVKVNNVHGYDYNGTKGTASFKIQDKIIMLDNQLNPDNVISRNLTIGDPIEFYLQATYAYCDFTLTYYKSGTYDANKDQGVDGNISNVNGFFNDLDAYSARCATFDFMCGTEGVVPNVGHSSIYYDQDVKEGQEKLVGPKDNGIASIKTVEKNNDSWYYRRTALILTDSVSSSTYSFTYGGLDCRMDYFFAPPFAYDPILNSLRSVSKDVIRPGESLIYKTSQYMPNNYYSMAFGFEDIYDNFKSSSDFFDKASYTYFALMDTVDDNYEINKENIFISNENNRDVTKDFDLSIKGNNVIAIAKDYNFSNSTFYSHTYSLNVPVTLKENTENLKNIANKSKTVYRIGNRENVEIDTNIVNVDINYFVKVSYIDIDTGNSIIDSEEINVPMGNSIQIDLAKIPKDYHLINPEETNIFVTKNSEITYKFKYNPNFKEEINNPPTGYHNFIITCLILVCSLLGLNFLKNKNKKIYKI